MRCFLLALVLCPIYVLAQKPQYKLIIHDFCKDSFYVSPCYFLYQSESWEDIKKNTWRYVSVDTSFCNLPSIGYYWLGAIENAHGLPKQLFFEEGKLYVDTIRLSSVNEYVGTTTAGGYYGYHCCDSLCNGNIVEYYEDGQISFSGTFKDGLPIDNLYYYYRNGNIKEIHFFTKKHKYLKVECYDEQKRLIKTEEKGYVLKIIDPFKKR